MRALTPPPPPPPLNAPGPKPDPAPNPARTPDQTLNLESNSISSGGMSAIAAALAVNKTLVELKLSNQHIAFSQQSEMEIAQSLESNFTLTKVPIPQ